MNAIKPWLATATLAALLSACASTPPPAVLLTLPPAAAPLAAGAAPLPASAASTPLLAVRRVVIPEYLVSRRVRYRADASTLAEWPNTYWAERVEIGVSREFVSAVRQQLPGWAVCDANCGDQRPALALQVELVPLDYLRGERMLQARARLTLSTGGAPPEVLRTEELTYRVPGDADTAQGQAQAMAKLIGQVAGAAATMIRAAPP
ncbi:MAG: ABC-type transport auxiliary lipoprotein family protein [Burkholderiaceae bacterium]